MKADAVELSFEGGERSAHAGRTRPSRQPRAVRPATHAHRTSRTEAGRRVHARVRRPRPAARLLSTMMGAFSAGGGGGGFGGGGGGFNFGGIGRPFVNADGTPKIGQTLFSDSFTLKSDIGNSVLRQTPIMNDGAAAKPVTWIEKGVLKTLYYDPATARRQKVAPSPATPNMSLVVEGTTQSIDD